MQKKILIAAIIVVILLWLFKEDPTPQDVQDSFGSLMAEEGFDLGKFRDLERIYRLETNSYKSEQFKQTYSPGMEATSKDFPFGWTSLKTWCGTHSGACPDSVVTLNDNATGKATDYVAFPSLNAAMQFMYYWLQSHNASDWNPSSDYPAKLAKMKTPVADAISTGKIPLQAKIS